MSSREEKLSHAHTYKELQEAASDVVGSQFHISLLQPGADTTHAAPFLRETTEQVLERLGYDPATCQELVVLCETVTTAAIGSVALTEGFAVQYPKETVVVRLSPSDQAGVIRLNGEDIL